MSAPLVMTRRSELQTFIEKTRASNKTIGFVPTMGALHDGHASLLTRAVSENDVCVLSIFVNPKQFGPNEDFSKYPRTLQDDFDLAKKAGVRAIFAPTVAELYPEGFSTRVSVSNLDDKLCGAYRPGHFDGVCTIVLLLLNLVRANTAYFGQKDFQQLTIIHRLCLDLAHPTHIVGVPTVREEDGVALSSRNRYLDEDARVKAQAIPRAMAEAALLFLKGEKDSRVLKDAALAVLGKADLTPQYLEIVSRVNLEAIEHVQDGEAVLALAQFVENKDGKTKTRLIDNIILTTEGLEIKEFLKQLSLENSI